MTIVPIVEGHGEVAAVPVLLRRVASEILNLPIVVSHPIRVPRSRLIRPDYLERAVELAARQGDAIMILVDADEDCAAELGRQLLQRATGARGDRALSVVLPTREYEAWLIGAARSLAGKRGLPLNLQPPDEADSVPDPKAWLDRALSTDATYRETIDQVAFTAILDLAEAQEASPSFRKLVRDLQRLLQAGGRSQL